MEPARVSPAVVTVDRQAAGLRGLLDGIGVSADSSRGAGDLLDARGPVETLRAWAARRIPLGERVSRRTLSARIGSDIALLDLAIGRQVDAVLHHAKFQALEGSWRGLVWLVEQAAAANDQTNRRPQVEIRLLSATKKELARDQQGAVEFDRSALWRKVYEEEFGTAGGTPYGLLVCDHDFNNRADDVSTLTGLSSVAAASFAPLVVNPSPELLGLDSFRRIDALPSPETFQSSPDFVKWQALRQREESRFVGLPLPRVLARLSYDGWIGDAALPAAPEGTWQDRGFRYREAVDGAGQANRLWMGGVWPFAGVVIREFGASGWFADIRGGSRGISGGGVVDALPVDGFSSLRTGEAQRGPVEVFVTEPVQAELDAAGFIPLCSSASEGLAVFESNTSLHRPATYDAPVATANARISSMLQYVLCVSRFAHALKVIARDKVGMFIDAGALERFLGDWISQYVTPDDQASAETRARMPLRAARIEVHAEPGMPGSFKIVMRLQPHFQLDRLDATLRLVTTVRVGDRR